jgi:hypothetical protein
MIGSETFIIVALRCTRTARPGLGVGDLLGEEVRQRAPTHHGGVEDLAGLERDRRLEDGHLAVGGHVLDAHLGRRSTVTERSRSGSRRRPSWRRGTASPPDHSPMRWGCLRA